MQTNYFEQYEEFIKGYYRLFHLQYDESYEDILNMISNVLISKFKVRINDLIISIFIAIKYNYRSIELYLEILKNIFLKFSISGTNLGFQFVSKIIRSIDMQITTNKDGIFNINYNPNSFPKENEIQYFLMHDQIDKFKEFILEHPIDDVFVRVPELYLSPIEACSFFGSVNIFNFLISNLNYHITQKVTQYSFIGGNTDIINECLKVNQIDRESILNIIVSHNDELLDYIFDRDINIPKDFDFIYPIISQNMKVVVHMFEKDKNSIIPWCAGIPQTIDIIKNENIDLNKVCLSKWSLLHYASYFNNLEICNTLLTRLKDQNFINAKNKDGTTALHISAISDSKEIAELLISKGADINVRDNEGKTALHYAVINNSKETAKFLLINGADITSATYGGKTALQCAMDANNTEIVKLFIPFYNDIIKKQPIIGKVLILYVLKHNMHEEISTLVSDGVNFKTIDIYGFPALHFAALHNYRDIVEQLILHGCDINSKYAGNQTPLHSAAQCNSKDVIQLLLSYGCDTEVKDRLGRTPLIMAAFYNNTEAAELLISHGVDITAKDCNNNTALYYATMEKNQYLIKILHSKLSGLNEKNKSGIIPINNAINLNNRQHNTEHKANKQKSSGYCSSICRIF